jgi:Holliday junction resolvasome RuvABC endonuclease subunit
MTQPTVLALDMATLVGYAVSPGICSGVKDLKPSPNQKPGARYQKLRNLLDDCLVKFPDLSLVMYEEPIPNHKGMAAAELAWGYVSIVKCWGADHQITVRGVHISTWKKFLTGSGNAQKEDVIDAVKRLGFYPQDHNHADALGIMCFATQFGGKDLNLV